MIHHQFFLTFFLSILLQANYAQSRINTKFEQSLEPHPVIELNNWHVHSGALPIKTIFSKETKKWPVEMMNYELWWGEEKVKWFVQSVTIPKNFEGKDVILELIADAQIIVYMDGEQIALPNN